MKSYSVDQHVAPTQFGRAPKGIKFVADCICSSFDPGHLVTGVEDMERTARLADQEIFAEEENELVLPYGGWTLDRLSRTKGYAAGMWHRGSWYPHMSQCAASVGCYKLFLFESEKVLPWWKEVAFLGERNLHPVPVAVFATAMLLWRHKMKKNLFEGGKVRCAESGGHSFTHVTIKCEGGGMLVIDNDQKDDEGVKYVAGCQYFGVPEQ